MNLSPSQLSFFIFLMAVSASGMAGLAWSVMR